MSDFRMPGYSLPKRQPWHWFILRKDKGDWFGSASGSLFSVLPDRIRDPGTRLFTAIRHAKRGRYGNG